VEVYYLHGFASSAQSSKASFFGARLAERGITLRVPDFNEPDFSTLTISRMVEQVVQSMNEVRGPRTGPTALIGSSLGAFVAIQVALRRPSSVSRLVLLAPALDIGGNRLRDLGDRGIDEWRRTNTLNVFHHGDGKTLPLRFDFYTDALNYDALGADLGIPVQVFQGQRDAAVDPALTRRWSSSRPNVELHELDDDHQLYASLEYIWKETARFLELT
jgi:uncharacterized protein